MKIKFDFKSIRFKVWVYFILFALMMFGVMWLLQIIFLDSFYEQMKLKETNRFAQTLIEEYRKSGDVTELKDSIDGIVEGSDIYIRVETGDGRLLLAPHYNGYMQKYLYSFQAANMRYRLENGELPATSDIREESNGSKTLSYATYLYIAYSAAPAAGEAGDNAHAKGAVASRPAGIIPQPGSLTKPDNKDISASRSIILYMFAPLYPVASTVSILHTQLIYIIIISMILALIISVILASRISRPINEITASAARMGKGDYGVRFRGGHYSEITELADTLTHASHELEKTSLYQKDLIANVSHDLKTPLSMIRSYAEMIRDLSGDDKEKRERHLNVIIEEAGRLNAIVNDMLSLTRMQQRKIRLEIAEFDLRKAVKTLLYAYDILAEKDGYTFDVSLGDPVYVSGDEAKLKQVITNLINNAIKYCGEDKFIRIALVRRGRSKVRLEVTDHGQGIAPDEIPHVWERYYKSSTHHVRPTEGSGLGLSIVKEILNLHKLDFGVESECGKGSTFWFEMNAIKWEKDTAKQRDRAATDKPGAKNSKSRDFLKPWNRNRKKV